MNLGADLAAVLFDRVADLMAAQSASEVPLSQIVRGNELEPDKLKVRLGDGSHLLLVSNHREHRVQPHAEVDWASVRRVKIVEVWNEPN